MSGPDESIGTAVSRTVEDAKAYARAEIAWIKALAASRTGDAGMAVGLGVGALVVALSALTTLLVGLVFALSPQVGPGWATAIVVVAALLLAAVLAMMALGRVRRVSRPLDADA